jgi:hypothetical protein
MDNNTAQLETRRDYLTRELAVWSARLQRAETTPALRVLYWDHELNKALGALRGELERINNTLGRDSGRPEDPTRGRLQDAPVRRKGTRRINPKRSN